MSMSPLPPPLTDAELRFVLENVEREWQMSFTDAVARLRRVRFADGPRLRVVAANRTPTARPLMEPCYGRLRQQIRVIK